MSLRASNSLPADVVRAITTHANDTRRTKVAPANKEFSQLVNVTAAAAEALSVLDGDAYRSFNLVVADNSGAFWLRHDGKAAIRSEAIPPGFSMFTAHDRNSPESPRVRRYLPSFEDAQPPDPEHGKWQSWEKLLACQENDESDENSEAAMCVVTPFGFGTVNASLLALPAPSSPPRHPVWRFSGGPPNENSFSDIEV